MLSLSPSGLEFHANTYTTLAQTNSAVAADGNGDFVIVWESNQEGVGGTGIYAQRYNSAGVAQGTEIHVNSLTTSSQTIPSIAMDADGDFVIVWASNDGVNGGVRAQRFNSLGVSQGGEFSVAGTGATGPSIGIDAAGNFVVAWSSLTDGSGAGVFARRYRYDGVAQGSNISVNTFTTGTQFRPAVAMAAAGEFVVAWDSNSQDGSGYGVYARRFNASGVGQGSEFRVNSYTINDQANPAVAIDSSGDIVIAWSSFQLEGGIPSSGVYAQRYNAAGVLQGTEIHVNTYTTGQQGSPAVAMDADGDFLVVWSGDASGETHGSVFAQQFNASGSTIGTEFRVNTYTTEIQSFPAVAADHKGDFIVSWSSNAQEGPGTSYGIFAQRYAESTDTAGPIITGVFVDGQYVLPYSVQNGPLSRLVAGFSEDMSVAGGSGGANSVTNVANWSARTLRSGSITDHTISGVTYQFNVITNRFEATLQLASPVSGNIQIIPSNLRDVAGNALDGDMDGVAGGGTSRSFNIGPGRVGSEFRVNSFTTNQQTEPAAATDADGDFVVVWTSDQDGSSSGIYGQRYNANGGAQGSEFQVNTYTTSFQSSPVVAMDSDGDFVVAWQSWNQDGSLWGVYARRFNSAGVAASSEFRVNTSTLISQMNPSVAMDPAGNFVVAWESSHELGDYNIYAQRYNASGVAQGSQFRVNSYTTNLQTRPSVAADSSGSFIIAWQSDGQDGSGYGIYAQSYSGTGSLIGGEFRANAYTTGNQQRPSVARGDGLERFLIVWESAAQDGDDLGVFAKYFVSGIALSEFRVSTWTTGAQQRPHVAMESDGGFVVAWDSTGQDASLTGTYAQRLNVNAEPKGAEFLVNSTTNLDQDTPAVAVDSSGGFVVAWEGSGSGDSDGIFAQRFRYEHLAPAATALSALPNPVAPPGQVTLTATGVSDDESVVAVRFFRESNGVAGFQYGTDGDTLVATDSNGIDGWSAAISIAGLAAGNYSYWALPIDNIELLGTPVTASSTVSTGVSASVFHYDTLPQKLRFTFNADVFGSIGVEDISLIKIDGGEVPALTMLSYGTDGTNVVTFQMTAQLADGNYRATIDATGVAGMSADHVFDFFIFGGDATHDRIVDARDLVALSNNWYGSGKTFSQGDFNFDGVVDQIDLTVLAQKWQQKLDAPLIAAPAAPATPAPRRTPIRTPVRAIDLVE